MTYFSDCDSVIEAVSEDLNLKKRIFSDLDRICSEHTVLGTDTSNLCIMEIASATRRQEKVLRIDKAAGLGLNHPMGPFTLMDLAGLDMMCLSVKGRYEELPIPEFMPPALLKRMVHAGRLGRKTGKGWYEYNEKGEKVGVIKLEKVSESLGKEQK